MMSPIKTRFSSCLRQQAAKGITPVIPDIKCVSPKAGDLLQGRTPLSMAKLFLEAGAPALSVVTEPRQFGGSLQLLEQVATLTDRPILRKDFILEPQQLVETAQAGASAVLLIVAMLKNERLVQLFENALALGLEPLVEVHTKKELQRACQLPLTLLGVNNKDILQLERDAGTVTTTEQLLQHKPTGVFAISESGITTLAEGRTALRAGADGLLIGTALWQATQPALTYKNFCNLGDSFGRN